MLPDDENDAERRTARSELDLATAQLRAIEAWNAARRAQESAQQSTGLTREMRLDLSRRMEARRREQRALLDRVHEQLRKSGDLLEPRPRLRALLAHRNAWICDTVAARLGEHGIDVVGVFDDGADAAGTLVVEQPDLLLVEDRLPTLSGVQVVRRAHEFAPRTVVGAHVLDGDSTGVFVQAGAAAVFTRRIPPVDVADQLVACLHGRPRVLTLV